MVSAFEGAPGVGRVQDQQKTLDKLFTVMNVVTIGSLFLAGLMVLCSILLMATTIRQAAFSRRRETGIMKLVGASNFTIRLPFVMETVLAALTGTGLAIVGLWVTADSLLPRVSAVLQDAPLVGTTDIWFVAPVADRVHARGVGADLLGHAAPLPARLTLAPDCRRGMGRRGGPNGAESDISQAPIPRNRCGVCYQ